ncbi:helix-hairpin-helix domain-containing protein [Streptosporangium sp. 'caverna']|uniref:ComEA family DNA-binding protein n=1 Tax=Streptosporangium sp. 'caverna' TaxID=2202249 RepID=UPI000D7E604B|nr:helix-hairpin-helix domain-containing protein [Streptosporangium sp. 'caverna']AWS42759.1 hypothetical protein DKM19_16705 [Streptosporangium sp. 'caverna']
MTHPVRKTHSPSPLRTALSFLWALLPLVSLGVLSPLVFGYAAGRKRSWPLWLATAVYTALVVTLFSTSDSAPGSAGDVAFLLSFIGCMLVGTAHALAIRRSVFAPHFADPNEQALAAARNRAELRRQARDLVTRDPTVARNAGVGRPDLPRQYDDGGLIDVNHAPPSVLAMLPGMTQELVDRLVQVRTTAGPFVSAEELFAAADLPPHLTPGIAEFAVFFP